MIATSLRSRPILLSVFWAVALLWSGWAPFDRATWMMEVAPVLIAWPVLWITDRRHPLTDLAFWLIALHGLILMVGGAYSYARVPAGFVVQEWLGLARNPYDRLGHFAQGFVPAILARELFLRTSPLRRGGWLFFVGVAAPLAFSAFYELLEWWAALASGEAATDFLGTQGDVWDTQWDMFLALVGAIVAQLLLARLHDRSLARVAPGA